MKLRASDGDGLPLAVGTTNKSKLQAVVNAAERCDIAIEAVDVESGVSSQPLGDSETLDGARTRARRAYEAGDAILGIGIEGGVIPVDESPADCPFVVDWAVVTDGQQTGQGSGPRLPIPEPMAARAVAGEEFGEILDDRFEAESVDGAVGALTDGRLTRTEAVTVAVGSALAPFTTNTD